VKKLFRAVIKDTMSLIYIIYPVALSGFIQRRLNQLYTLWIVNSFKSAGTCLFSYPLYIKGGKYISVGDNCSFDKRLRLDAYDYYASEYYSPSIEIGKNVSIQMDCHICAINNIRIGNNVLIASKVYISDHFHGNVTAEELDIAPVKRKLFSKGPVIIGDNVWIGEGVVIMPGVEIGNSCIIGANAVVTKSFPKDSVIGGNPARLIKVLNQ
jgi:acetyltransferase-like isoleucine patch superfamily enzyme